jgi:hypothetical protein
MEKADLPAVVDCENKSHEYLEKDEDFEIEHMQLRDWAWSKTDFEKAIEQYKSHTKGTNDTRARVAVQELQDGTEQICGACVFELQDEGYEILILTVNPKVKDPALVQETLVGDIMSRGEKHPKRKKILVYVPDGDYVTLAFFMKWGYNVKPVGDNWFCEKGIPAKIDKNQLEDAI